QDALASASAAEIETTGRYQGILGLDVFDGYVITLDLKKGRWILYYPGDEAVGDASGRRYWNVSGQILVETNPGDAPPGLFMVDTGASTSVVAVAYDASSRTAALRPA